MIVVINVEGVLAEPGQDLMQCSPLQSGRLMYEAFRDKHLDVVLMSVSRNRVTVVNWLTREGFHGHILLKTAQDSIYNGGEYKQETIEQLLADQQFIGFVVDADLASVRMYAKIGVNMLLFVPAWEKPGRKIDAPYKPWSTLVDELQAESLERARLVESRQADG